VRRFKADLHIHSCLSPCGDLDMSPRGIVEASLQKGLDLIALCDHNTAENVGAVIRAGKERGLWVLPGMEVNSYEEVHSLALFDREAQVLEMQTFVYNHLQGTNRPELFGEQVVANEFDEVEGFNDRLLIGATGIRLVDIINKVHRLGGLCIASHVDRPSYSVVSQLGFISPGLEFDALEVSPRTDLEKARKDIPGAADYPLVTFSDAHFLKDIGGVCTEFLLDHPGIEEIRMALKQEQGRGIVEGPCGN